MNPYYRCFDTADGFLAVACLNLAQRSAFLDLFGLEDPTIDASDLVPDDQALLTAKETVTAEIEREIAGSPTEEWLARLEAAGVPCGLVQTREGVHADPQVIAAGLVGQVDQPDLGDVRMLAPFVRFGGSTPGPAPAPALGADTEAVLGGLERR